MLGIAKAKRFLCQRQERYDYRCALQGNSQHHLLWCSDAKVLLARRSNLASDNGIINSASAGNRQVIGKLAIKLRSCDSPVIPCKIAQGANKGAKTK